MLSLKEFGETVHFPCFLSPRCPKLIYAAVARKKPFVRPREVFRHCEQGRKFLVKAHKLVTAHFHLPLKQFTQNSEQMRLSSPPAMMNLNFWCLLTLTRSIATYPESET